MKAIALATGLVVGLLPNIASSQDMFEMMLEGLGQSVEEVIGNAPKQLDDLLQSTQAGKEFASNNECLGALQVGVNAAVVVANIMPFSSVNTLEDDRGPVGRMRLMLNGDKFHAEAFCEGSLLKATPLAWGQGNPELQEAKHSTFDAAVGLLLLAQLQGAFDDIGGETPDDIGDETSSVDQALEQTTEPMPRWERTEGQPSAYVYSLDTNRSDRAAYFKIRCRDEGLYFFLRKSNVLFRKSDAIGLLITTNGQATETAISATVDMDGAVTYDDEIVIQLISVLTANEADTFAFVVETFDAPLRMEFPMSGFKEAMRPVVGYCPLAANYSQK